MEVASQPSAPGPFAPRVFSIYATEDTPETCYDVLGVEVCFRNPVVVGLLSALAMDGSDALAADPFYSMQGYGDRVY
jgi:hypothetical protein